MSRKLVISTEHSTHENDKTQKIEVPLMGGSPYFAYLWINDVCYSFRVRARSVEVKKPK